MLKKTIRRLGALAMVLAMAVSVFAVNASAADTDTGSDTGTGTTQTDAVVTKVVTKGQYTYAPDAEFEFTVTRLAYLRKLRPQAFRIRVMAQLRSLR